MQIEKDARPLVIWLMACCFMVFMMAVIGAITRLTESGLSIAEWKPVSGALPPLTHAEWERVYDLYRKTPEFVDKHSWMQLSDFKKIFFWEWLHRLWGRAIGLVYALPLLWFWARGMIPTGFKPRLAGLLLLGGAQGALGWYMVASGLVDRPEVSHFRLAAHLLLALLIYCAMLWVAMQLGEPARAGAPRPRRSLTLHGAASLALLAVTICWGAFTAGLDAGLIYNTFPLMSGQFTPPESFAPLSPLTQQAWVQFTHRWLAVTTGLVILSFAWRVKEGPLAGMVFVQIGLGIATLLLTVPVGVAALHQAGAIVLLSLLLRAFYRLQAGTGAEASSARR
jgi:cytochrome c oxidase assembly protein subunit 15